MKNARGAKSVSSDQSRAFHQPCSLSSQGITEGALGWPLDAIPTQTKNLEKHLTKTQSLNLDVGKDTVES